LNSSNFIAEHPDAKSPLNVFIDVAREAVWKSIVDVRQIYPHADAVGKCTVFNIKGNHYRLVVKIDYRTQIIYIKKVLTHAEYDKGKWKNDCS
jgi:mRNA interferase HigB